MIDPLGGPVYWLAYILALIIGYLIGSVPFGLIITRAAGAGDVRQIGSGNIGATNVLRTGRKGLALATLLADLAKGWLPVVVAYALFGPDVAVAAGLGTVVGHCFPIWLKFRGGKGVATAAGVILGLTPVVFPIALALFVAVVWWTKLVSLGSILAAASAPIAAYLLGYVQAAELYLVIALIVIAMHHQNIVRLFKGEENRISFRKPPA